LGGGEPVVKPTYPLYSLLSGGERNGLSVYKPVLIFLAITGKKLKQVVEVNKGN
jgi:hypothetical protein